MKYEHFANIVTKYELLLKEKMKKIEKIEETPERTLNGSEFLLVVNFFDLTHSNLIHTQKAKTNLDSIILNHKSF